MEKITIGIPTKNAEHFIYRTIQSVLIQNYPNIEILIVDDSGLKDNLNVLNLKREFNWTKNIRFIHNKKNLGIGASRNILIDNALGKYLFFLSDDDELTSGAIETMMKVAKENPNSIIYSNYYIMDKDSKILQEFNAPRFYGNADFKRLVINYAKTNNMFVCYNLLAPISLLKKNKFKKEYRFAEDFEHLLRCALVKNINFVHIPKSLFKYRLHDGSTTAHVFSKIAYMDSITRKEVNKSLGLKLFK